RDFDFGVFFLKRLAEHRLESLRHVNHQRAFLFRCSYGLFPIHLPGGARLSSHRNPKRRKRHTNEQQDDEPNRFEHRHLLRAREEKRLTKKIPRSRLGMTIVEFVIANNVRDPSSTEQSARLRIAAERLRAFRLAGERLDGVTCPASWLDPTAGSFLSGKAVPT